MAENYIRKLQRENAELKRQNEEKDKKFEDLAKQVAEIKEEKAKPVVETSTSPVETTDDRDEIIDVYIERERDPDGQGRAIYRKHQMTKRDAFESLVSYYINRKGKAVPGVHDGPEVNTATVYARITKRDVSTGRKLIATNDMPLWIAAERAIEGKAVELISKSEYEKIQLEKAAHEKQYSNDYNQKKIQNAIQALNNI